MVGLYFLSFIFYNPLQDEDHFNWLNIVNPNERFIFSSPHDGKEAVLIPAEKQRSVL